MIVTPAQVRAGRALLDITRDQLAHKSGVSTSAIANFENGKSVPIRANLVAIKQALEQLGVEFLPGGGLQLREGEGG